MLDEAQAAGRPTLAITNDPASPLAEAADWVLPLHAGEERAVAATKTYLNSIAAVALLSAVALGDAERLAELHAMPGSCREADRATLGVAGALDRYSDVESGSVVTRGVNYGTAFEIALKIRELSGAPFEAFSSADLLHGPIAAVKRGRPAIVIAPSGPDAQPACAAAIDKIRERGRSDRDQRRPGVPRGGRNRVPTRARPAGVARPLLTVVPGQVAAVRAGEALQGADIDSPAGLTKITLTH